MQAGLAYSAEMRLPGIIDARICSAAAVSTFPSLLPHFLTKEHLD
jgi:hypothetical protein